MYKERLIDELLLLKVELRQAQHETGYYNVEDKLRDIDETIALVRELSDKQVYKFIKQLNY